MWLLPDICCKGNELVERGCQGKKSLVNLIDCNQHNLIPFSVFSIRALLKWCAEDWRIGTKRFWAKILRFLYQTLTNKWLAMPWKGYLWRQREDSCGECWIGDRIDANRSSSDLIGTNRSLATRDWLPTKIIRQQTSVLREASYSSYGRLPQSTESIDPTNLLNRISRTLQQWWALWCIRTNGGCDCCGVFQSIRGRPQSLLPNKDEWCAVPPYLTTPSIKQRTNIVIQNFVEIIKFWGLWVASNIITHTNFVTSFGTNFSSIRLPNY